MHQLSNRSLSLLLVAGSCILTAFAQEQPIPSIPPVAALEGNASFAAKTLTDAELKKIYPYKGTSGPGLPTEGDGSGGWRSGSAGVTYQGNRPKPYFKVVTTGLADRSVIAKGLLPDIKPLLEVQVRDTVMTLGGDGNYYMTGSTGENIWAVTDGVELWRSSDLQHWTYLGLVWSLDKNSTWEKQTRIMHDKPVRAIWAPEIHYIHKNYFICLSMAPFGIGLLKSSTGRPEGPYVNALTGPDADKPLASGIDATLFEDDDHKVYFTYGSATKIALMKDDLSGLAEPFHTLVLADPDHDATHHAPKCGPRGTNDLGTEGAVLFKANGKYYLGAADDYQGRYSSMMAISDNIYGPYHDRHESVPSGGGTGFFKDKQGRWWSTYFGNDEQAAWREKPGLVMIEFSPDGKIHPAAKQPFGKMAVKK